MIVLMKILLLLVLSCLSFFVVFHFSNSETFEKTYTEALCENNACQDYLIECSGTEVKSMRPISGLVTFPTDWKDARPKKELCS